MEKITLKIWENKYQKSITYEVLENELNYIGKPCLLCRTMNRAVKIHINYFSNSIFYSDGINIFLPSKYSKTFKYLVGTTGCYYELKKNLTKKAYQELKKNLKTVDVKFKIITNLFHSGNVGSKF
jgi:hypothetical protein